MAAEKDKFELTAVRTAVHGTAEGRITAADHFIDIFHFSIPRVESIYNFFIMVFKNGL